MLGVLSIGKLVAGQERYYQRQIAKGLDDYYAGRGEAPGRWIGAGAASLGLGGGVEEGQLGALIAGLDPRSGDVLRVQETRVAALDLTFSAPKSVSVLFAVAPAPVSRILVVCHEEAVGAALAYLEETAAFVRRGPNAARRFEHAGGLVAAAYRHRMSRALDPQLHTHCVTANMARGPDGRWTALHHPSLYRAAQTAGYLYQAHLRVRVHDRLGLEWGPVRKGAAELAGIDPGLVEEFSRRRHEMRRAAEEDGGLGLDTKKRSEKAAIATRERKQYGVETHTWCEEVQARASEHGLDSSRISSLLQAGQRRVERERLDRESPRRLREVDDALAGADGLTAKDNTFDERAVLRAYAQAAGQGATVARLRARAAEFATRGDVLATQRGEMTTAELVGVERALIAAAQGRAGEGTGRVDKRTLVEALGACEREITGEQRAAVHATVTSGHGVQVIEALAGTGKTFTAGVLAYVYRRAGCEVLGVAPTGRAVRELTDEARIPSRTLASMVLRVRNGVELPSGCVVVLDEAGMAGTRETAVLLEAAARAGAKVVAIGDPGQLHSVQAGGWMRAVGRRVGALKLSEVMRQRDHGERRALGLLHEGVPTGWLAWAREHRRVELGGNDATPAQAVQEWAAAVGAHGLQQAVLIARSNDTRAALNERARQVVHDRGALGAERGYGPITVAVGDRVICRRNDREIDVDNGTRGTVRAVHRTKIMIETDGHTIRELPAGYVARHVEHAYALTGHGMQGGTVEWAGVVAAPHELTRGWSYTALSRARARTRLFVLDEGEGWAHHEHARRDEHAPGEREEKPTAEELVASVARYMSTRDDEDLAVEQLPAPAAAQAGRATEIEPNRGALPTGEDQGAEAEPEVAMLPTRAELESLTGRLKALEAQLASLETPEAERLQATDRRERALIAHHDELAERLARLPVPRRPRRDVQAVERQGIEQAIAGAQRELAGLRAVRARLEREVGPLAEVLSERAGLRQAIAQIHDERQHARDRLIESALAEPPGWARGLLGGRPRKASARRVYDQALAAVAGYRLDHGITGPRPLGSAPDDPLARRDYQRTVTRVQRAQQRLELIGGPYTPPPGVPQRYRVALGERRTRTLETLLDGASQRASGLTAGGLEQAIAVGRAALEALDARAAARALRLENQLDEHRQLAEQKTARARELAEQTKTVGWRQRSERQRLLEAAAELRDQVDHHQADLERIELELARLSATERHPDQWLARHAQTVADGLAAGVEHEQRSQADIDRQAARAALDPPPHVRDLLGERPTSGPTATQAWQRLAVALERHRLQYRINVAKDGPLGPSPADPTVRASVAYRSDRERLAREITRLRHQRGLEPHPEIPQFAPRRSPGRGPDPGR
jgi:conjugative relaxase-like TrwC/TraI family protein